MISSELAKNFKNYPYYQSWKSVQDGGMIIDVWRENLHESLADLSNLIEEYPIVSFDTEFPGIIYEGR